MRPHLDGGHPIKFVTMDAGAMVLNAFPMTCEEGISLFFLGWEVPKEKLEEFIRNSRDFTKQQR